MRTTTHYVFDGPARVAERRGKCPTCDKPVIRKQTFSGTVNPFNKNKATGAPKTWEEVAADVEANARAWDPAPEYFEHQRCYDQRNAPEAAGYEPVGEDDLARTMQERTLVRRWLDWTDTACLPISPMPPSWHTNRDTTTASVFLIQQSRGVCALADVLGVTEVKISRSEGDLVVRFTGKIADGTITIEAHAPISPAVRGSVGKVDRPKGETISVDDLAAWIETTGQAQYERRNR